MGIGQFINLDSIPVSYHISNNLFNSHIPYMFISLHISVFFHIIFQSSLSCNMSYKFTRNLIGMIHPHSASTFAQITHRGVDQISNSYPAEIGICYTPFPIASIRPDTSTFSGDNIPRCSCCSAFFNKFNVIENNRFKCSICGFMNNQTKYQVDPKNVECRNEVYEALVTRNYIKRQVFASTDFYIISLNLLRSYPKVLDDICETYAACSKPKQVGIAISHGAISIVKFRNSFSIQTFADDTPIVRDSQLFVNAPFFREFLPKIRNELLRLKFVENENFPRNLIDFGVSISTKFGTSLRLIFDENDFHCFSRISSLRQESLRMCQYHAQASVIVFVNSNVDMSNNFQYRNSLIDLPSFTGGFFRFLKANDGNGFNLSAELDPPLYHDAFLFVRPPDCGDIVDYCGHGYLKTNTGVALSKIQAGDTFYFTINSSKYKNPYIQFVVFYSTEINERHFRVTTLPLMELPIINIDMIKNYSAAMVAQRILFEDNESARQCLARLRKRFSCFENGEMMEKAESLLNGKYKFMQLYAICIDSRNGQRRKFLPNCENKKSVENPEMYVL